MARLGDVIGGMREDFIVVHLRDPCSHCRCYPEGTYWRWPPPGRAPRGAAAGAAAAAAEEAAVKAAHAAPPPAPGAKGGSKMTTSPWPQRAALCGPCYEAEAAAVARAAGAGGAVAALKADPDAPAIKPDPGAAGGPSDAPLPAAPGAPKGLPHGIALDALVKAEAEPLPATADPNPDVACEFFDTRQQFLSLCQGNHYQFDTLRRAKHSSMMVLYHLHNPDAPAFACTCNACGREIEAGAGFRCTVCSDFDMCATCRLNPAVRHPHPLAAHARAIDETRARLTDADRSERAAQLARTMALLRHASGCADAACASSNCAKVKALFQHAVACPLKVTGGCGLCRRMWLLLQMHAKSCGEDACPVPRCRELRDARRRQAARQEEQRRVAYQAMLRAQGGGGGARAN